MDTDTDTDTSRSGLSERASERFASHCMALTIDTPLTRHEVLLFALARLDVYQGGSIDHVAIDDNKWKQTSNMISCSSFPFPFPFPFLFLFFFCRSPALQTHLFSACFCLLLMPSANANADAFCERFFSYTSSHSHSLHGLPFLALTGLFSSPLADPPVPSHLHPRSQGMSALHGKLAALAFAFCAHVSPPSRLISPCAFLRKSTLGT